MDADQYTEEKKKTEHDHDIPHPADRFPAPTLSNPPSTTSSFDSEHSVLEAAADVHPSTPDMDGPDNSVRRRPPLMEKEDPPSSAKPGKRSRSRRHRRKILQASEGGEHKHLDYSSDDGHSSIVSTLSTSDDLERERIPSDEALTDDEEAGLTRKDKRKRKGRKTINTKLDERIAGSMGASSWSLADRNVIKASLINALLIASWYLFSVSISVVSCPGHEEWHRGLTVLRSITNGCSQRRTSTSNSRFSQPVCTWPCNSCWRPLYFISSHTFDLEQTAPKPRELIPPNRIANSPKGSH